jgi:hypothetical protein
MDEANEPFVMRVGLLGNPDSSTPFRFWKVVPWNDENLQQLKDLGFNTIQVNVAWGPRPDDEPLNLEDIIELPVDLAARYSQPVPLHCDPSPERRQQRRLDVRQRSEACHRLGLRTIFHFGAPYNAHMSYGDGPPNCISDEQTLRRYELLLESFADEFPEVDDILIYTYDQDAWLCSEFGPCPRCLGIPLHERVTQFLARLASEWRRHRPEGRLWWEPWELSSGQVYECVGRLPAETTGLCLHADIAEVQATLPADRWVKNTAGLAAQKGIPVIIEYWLGGPCEELEPLFYLAHPLVTLRGLRAIAGVPGVTGIKEYYGIDPEREDPNLRMTALFLSDATLSEEDALAILGKPYQAAADPVISFWRLTSQGMELYPWDASWYGRQIGRSRVDHALSGARIRGMACRTPSWCSTRQTFFLKAFEHNLEDDPWLREDVELRCRMAADAWQAALLLGEKTLNNIPASLRLSFERTLVDLGRLRRRALAYAYHLRETNLAEVLRAYPAAPQRISMDLRATLQADLINYEEERQAEGEAARLGMVELARLVNPGPMPAWTEAEKALELLEKDLPAFLEAYLLETPGKVEKGYFSITSR